LQSTVENPDKTEVIALPGPKRGLSIRLYLKSLRAKRPTYMLVVTNQHDGQSETITDAWYVPAHLCPENSSPLDVLSTLCRNFGLRIRIGRLTERLIYSQTLIPVDGQPVDFQPRLVDKPPRQGAKLNAAVMENEDGSVDVSLAYAIDIAALKRKLAS
jgi:hypothetical protein